MSRLDHYCLVNYQAMNIKSLPQHLRPREKLLEKGPANLKDRELLAILIRTGRQGRSAIDIGSDLLKHYSLDTLVNIELAELIRHKGIDKGKACSIIAAFELAKRALRHYETALPLVGTPEDALVHLQSIRTKRKEYFKVLYLNARNQLIRSETVSIGTLTASLVHPREVFAPALELRAASILLAHNHPSNNPEPSSEDVELTERLSEAGEILAIDVLDHLILTQREYYSFKQHELI